MFILINTNIKDFIIMSNYSTRYFQLTPTILIEYQYTNFNLDSTEDVSRYYVDIKENPVSVIEDKYNSSYNFLDSKDYIQSGYVLPANRAESKFIQGITTNSTVWDTLKPNITISNVTTSSNTDDVYFDNFRVHFTSRNIFGDYDGYIIRGVIYDKIKNKICLLSHYIRRTDDVNLNPTPMLLNQKLYTSYLDFRIPSTNALLTLADGKEIDNDAELNFRRQLSPKYDLLDNTPLVMSIYGVKATIEQVGFETYTTEKINTISIPTHDSYNQISITIKEADDGDYYKIYPEVSTKQSFSDYIYNISNGRPDTVIVMHELTLTEEYANNLNKPVSSITHREHYIINAAQDEDGTQINEDELDNYMIYRPVVKNASRCVGFVINDQLRIINTLDNTTIVKTGEYRTDSNTEVKKYGKRMNKIYLGSIPAQVNVYNKKPDIDTDGIKLTNSSSNVKIENHQHSVTGFIESVNVGVTIEQIPTESIDQ